ncbi:MAG: hypothetical protein KC635_20040 [Myxococcales bacterium]|nr:hypothetical protein [Myxococcales bacterium]MCB9733642.1 hypothetical protein [Deltaproteobacteria bacterium]
MNAIHRLERSAGRRLRALVAAVVVAGALVTGGATARAGYSEDGFETEEISAFTLRPQELKVGPAAIRLGLPGHLQLGTAFALNLLGAFNGDLKWRIYETDAVAFGLASGIVVYDPGSVGVDSDFSVTAVPLDLDVTFKPARVLQIHVRLRYLSEDANERAPDAVLRIQRYLGPVGRLAGELAVEWRASDHVALVLDGAVPIAMHDETFLYADEDPDDRGKMSRVALSLFGSFDAFVFRAGVGYGPSFLGKQSVFPVVDLYWRIF